MAGIPHNKLQDKARLEGYSMALRSFTEREPFDIARLVGMLNNYASHDRTDEAVLQQHERDKEGDLLASTTIRIGKSEADGYRLLGYFQAVEYVRQRIDATGARITSKASQ